MFHSWLLQHQLLDGKGLTGILTEQQLQRGKQDTASMGLGSPCGDRNKVVATLPLAGQLVDSAVMPDTTLGSVQGCVVCCDIHVHRCCVSLLCCLAAQVKSDLWSI